MKSQKILKKSYEYFEKNFKKNTEKFVKKF